MPKKRTSTESNNDEQTKEDGSGSIVQEDDGAKRSKLEPLNDTTLQDLPIEMLESILIKAVAMEVLELKVARCARKEQADLVMERLGTVCSQWNFVLTTDIFMMKVHRLLEGEETIRFEILDQPTFQVEVLKLATLKDEIFLLCSPLHYGPTVINVYDRNNMAEVKDVIPLVPKMYPIDMASCIVSNCVYILNQHVYYSPSVHRIKKDEEHDFKVSSWLHNQQLPFDSRGPMSVSSNGNVLILSSEETRINRHGSGLGVIVTGMAYYVSIFNASGAKEHTIMLTQDIYGFKIINSVIQKSDGNLVLLAANNKDEAKLLEIDTSGRILRQYQSSLHGYSVMSFADVYGRILVTDQDNRIEIFDPDFNLLEIADPRPSQGLIWSDPQIHFNSERNEIVRFELFKFGNRGFDGSVLSIFRLTNE